MSYVHGVVIAFLLGLRGVTALHGGAVSRGSNAVALLGPAGAGKSTLVAALAGLGWTAITDDVLSVVLQDDSFRVHPAGASLRVWSDVAGILEVDPTAMSRVLPARGYWADWDKRHLDPACGRARCHDPVRLVAACVLEPLSESEESARLERMSGSRALLAILSNTFLNDLPDPAARSRAFDAGARLIRSCPVHALRRPGGRAGIIAAANALESLFPS